MRITIGKRPSFSRPRLIALAILALTLVLGAALAGQAPPAHAQDGSFCPQFVDRALASLESLCSGLARDTACYGNSRVDSEFWIAPDSLAFSTPADRVPLIDLRTISTAPLDLDQELWGVAVMHLQASLPDTLPGQAVTFLLMGDTTVENAVTPEQAAARPVVDPVPAEAVFPANLRSRPSTNANAITSVPAGTPLTLVGRDETGGWFEVTTGVAGNAWVSNDLVAEDDALAAALPITYGPSAAPRYGPMQAFYLSTGLGGATCNEAPSALIVQSTELAEVALNVNALEIHIGSTIALMTYTAPDGTPLLIAVLLEGHLRTTLNGVPVALDAPGEAVAITLNADGLVDASSDLVDLPPFPDLLNLLQGLCSGGLLPPGALPQDVTLTCTDSLVNFYTPPAYLPPATDPPGDEDGDNPPATQEPAGDVPTGGWGGCGSCDYCGPYAQGECVQSPAGECLWDPATCGYHGPPPGSGGGASAGLFAPAITCTIEDYVSTTATYHSPDGATISGYSVSSSLGVEYWQSGPNTITMEFWCENGSVSVSVTDTAGRSFSTSFAVTAN